MDKIFNSHIDFGSQVNWDKNQIELETHSITLKFIKPFNKHFDLEVKNDYKQARQLEENVFRLSQEIANLERKDAIRVDK
ncbi:hypothetical protein CR532_04510 (plasmid) [Candidatus Borreliella tachyglossi]|uniref:Uncharacterized protein n=1 Tax=Candidatus Borreliella tachyglossi TaxID=1964448 RepID=A0A2S1LY98_9SPIR|nr:hypothetical protein [Candidatus Borreliella tachyglossi]AWG43262.1 hypothetical protein CR532_04510 [Candidatus Borreliella tachyglossi]